MTPRHLTALAGYALAAVVGWTLLVPTGPAAVPAHAVPCAGSSTNPQVACYKITQFNIVHGWYRTSDVNPARLTAQGMDVDAWRLRKDSVLTTIGTTSDIVTLNEVSNREGFADTDKTTLVSQADSVDAMMGGMGYLQAPRVAGNAIAAVAAKTAWDAEEAKRILPETAETFNPLDPAHVASAPRSMCLAAADAFWQEHHMELDWTTENGIAWEARVMACLVSAETYHARTESTSFRDEEKIYFKSAVFNASAPGGSKRESALMASTGVANANYGTLINRARCDDKAVIWTRLKKNGWSKKKPQDEVVVATYHPPPDQYCFTDWAVDNWSWTGLDKKKKQPRTVKIWYRGVMAKKIDNILNGAAAIKARGDGTTVKGQNVPIIIAGDFNDYYSVTPASALPGTFTVKSPAGSVTTVRTGKNVTSGALIMGGPAMLERLGYTDTRGQRIRQEETYGHNGKAMDAKVRKYSTHYGSGTEDGGPRYKIIDYIFAKWDWKKGSVSGTVVTKIFETGASYKKSVSDHRRITALIQFKKE
jgi:hypothetical protein